MQSLASRPHLQYNISLVHWSDRRDPPRTPTKYEMPDLDQQSTQTAVFKCPYIQLVNSRIGEQTHICPLLSDVANDNNNPDGIIAYMSFTEILIEENLMIDFVKEGGKAQERGGQAMSRRNCLFYCQ